EERHRRRTIVNHNNYAKNRDKILNSRLKISEIRSLQEQVSEVQLLRKREKQLLSYITESGLIPPPPVIEIDPNMISSNYQEEIAPETSSEISNSSNAINNELSNYQEEISLELINSINNGRSNYQKLPQELLQKSEFMFLREEITSSKISNINNELICPSYVPNMMAENDLNITSFNYP
ncbi:28061_t:CDS:2, partial [Gigaspora margarita]